MQDIFHSHPEEIYWLEELHDLLDTVNDVQEEGFLREIEDYFDIYDYNCGKANNNDYIHLKKREGILTCFVPLINQPMLLSKQYIKDWTRKLNNQQLFAIKQCPCVITLLSTNAKSEYGVLNALAETDSPHQFDGMHCWDYRFICKRLKISGVAKMFIWSMCQEFEGKENIRLTYGKVSEDGPIYCIFRDISGENLSHWYDYFVDQLSLKCIKYLAAIIRGPYALMLVADQMHGKNKVNEWRKPL